MSLQIGTLYEKHAEVETIDDKTGEVRKAKRIYYDGTIQLAAFPHLSGRVNIVPRQKPTPKSPDWTVKRHAHGQWFEIGTAFNGELEAGGSPKEVQNEVDGRGGPGWRGREDGGDAAAGGGDDLVHHGDVITSDRLRRPGPRRLDRPPSCAPHSH
jgi:hypothetical protein